MKKARVIAVCTVGLVLVLLGGLPSVDQTHSASAIGKSASAVYAAEVPDSSVGCYTIEGECVLFCTFEGYCEPFVRIEPDGSITIGVRCGVKIGCVRVCTGGGSGDSDS